MIMEIDKITANLYTIFISQRASLIRSLWRGGAICGILQMLAICFIHI